MYQKSAQKLSTDECYPDSVIGEFRNFSASLHDLMPYYKLTLPVVNSFSGDREKFYLQIYKLYSEKNLSHECSLILSFDVVNQILAHLTVAKLHTDILVYENSDIWTLTEKDISIISYLSGYVLDILQTVAFYEIQYQQLLSATMLIIFNGRKMFWREFTLTWT